MRSVCAPCALVLRDLLCVSWLLAFPNAPPGPAAAAAEQHVFWRFISHDGPLKC
jgi:hypothetical protein